MNTSQFLSVVQARGLTDTDEGHLVAILDVWTGSVMATVFHPEPNVRSLTLIVSSCVSDAAQGNLLSGGVPTVHGADWTSVADEALKGAYLVSMSYISDLYTVTGFSLKQFLEGPGESMTHDEKHRHLDLRMEHGAMVKGLLKMSEAAMALEDTDAKAQLTNYMVQGFEMTDAQARELHAVDGQ